MLNHNLKASVTMYRQTEKKFKVIYLCTKSRKMRM